MTKLWVATVIAFLSSIPLLSGAGIGHPISNRILDTIAILSVPGTFLAHTLAVAGRNFPDVVNSLAFVFIVSVIGNTLVYWAVFSLVATIATMFNRNS